MSPSSSKAAVVVLTLLLPCAATAFVPSSRLLLPHRQGGQEHSKDQRRRGDRDEAAATNSNSRQKRRPSRQRPTRMHAATDLSEEDSYATLAGLEMGENSGMGFKLATKAVDTLFAFEPFFDRMVADAREKIVARSDVLGVGWDERVDRMRRNMDQLEDEYDRVLSPKVSTPAYYYAPFHCYPEGNLSWDAALEVEPSALCVHANIYTPDKKVYERGGDDKLRSNFHQRMRELLKGPEPKNILDIGCSTGLSTLKLAETFPSARITGVDLSPHMLAVGRFFLRTKEDQREARGRVEYVHAAGEMTGMAEGSMDMVSLSLTSHELPAEATREIFREAFRVLRPGGAISFMDMNPFSPAFQQLFKNPFAFAGFSSSEPYLQDYISIDLGKELVAAGFRNAEVRSNSPRHRTCVAYADK